MKGHEKVIERLNEALFLELGVVNQYWLHYRLAEDWGYTHFANKEREESVEEMKHVDKLVKRIIFLEGFPNMQTLSPLRIGQNIREILECDLAAEYKARESYRISRELCHDLSDHISKKIFDDLLEDEEKHIDYLETQLTLLSQIGEQKYGQLNAGTATESEKSSF